MPKRNIISPTNYTWDPNMSSLPYAVAVERNGLLCISGLTAEEYDPTRGSYLVKNTNVSDQVDTIFDKMDSILNASGYTFQDIVYTVDYAVPAAMPGYKSSGEVRRKRFGCSMPASVGVLVDGIPNSSGMIMINAVAMRGGRYKLGVFPETTALGKNAISRTFWPGFLIDDKWLWLSGTTGRYPTQPEGRMVYPKGIMTQSASIWTHGLGKVIQEASVNPSRVVRVCDYIHPAAIGDYPQATQSRDDFVKGASYSSTGLVIQRLLHSDALLETDATCYLGDDLEVIKMPHWQDTAGDTSKVEAVRCEKYIFCSAQEPLDRASGRPVGRGDIKSQAVQVYTNLSAVLKAAGAGMDDVVRTVESTNPQNVHNWDVLDRARVEAFNGQPPAVTKVTANQTLRSGTDFSLEAWAVLS